MKSIGPYRIERMLGRGAMSTVYKVRLPVIEKIAALKCLDPPPKLLERIELAALRALFVREASRMAGFRHPNILDVWNFEEIDGRYCYLMAFYCHNLGSLIGETYWADAPTRRMRLDRTVYYLRGVLAGLRRMHHDGVVHRDVKPFNILLSENDTVKIADFGLSKVRGEKSLLPDSLLVGTKSYAAPEQLSDPDAVGPAADIYSVGVLMYRMLTGSLPGNPPEPPSRRNSNLDRDWDAFFEKAVHNDPELRFSDVGDMAKTLSQLYQDYTERREKVCRLLPQEDRKFFLTAAENAEPADRLRSQASSVGAKRAKIDWRLDALWRPRQYAAADLVIESGRTARDRATGLLWQQGGADYPMGWAQAGQYVEFLNETAFSGRSTWRLPTIEELISILIPPPEENDFCLAPLFDQKQKWLWSADRRSFKSAWYVNVEMGFVSSYDDSGLFFVKAVCSEMVDKG